LGGDLRLRGGRTQVLGEHPQRTDQTVIGFQRPEDKARVEKAKKFFDLGTTYSGSRPLGARFEDRFFRS
jgi:hypothetical protein